MKKPAQENFFDGLDDEEKELLEAELFGKLIPVENFEEEKALLVRAARNSYLMRKPISIRIPVDDLDKIKEEAKKTRIPYQTLLTSIIHRHVCHESQE